MTLTIIKNSDDCTQMFAQYIANIISREIKSSINRQKLIQWDDYFSHYGVMLKHKPYDGISMDLILCASNNLIVDSYDDKYVIRVNDKVFFKNWSDVNVYKYAKLISFGNVEMKGYPIIQHSMDVVGAKIPEYFMSYSIIA